MLNPITLISGSLLYFAFVFWLAKQSATSSELKKLVNHPITYTLSLGGYAGVWVIFGVTEIANQQGYQFLAYYFGASLLFIFSPLLLRPLINIAQHQRLSSLADLFSYRYNSQWAGSLVAIGLLALIFPLLSWQIDTISRAAVTLSGGTLFSQPSIAFGICVLAFAFAWLFGTRSTSRGKHDELVLLSAFSALFKLFVLLLLGALALFALFSSPLELVTWLEKQPTTLAVLSDSLTDNSSRTLFLIFSAAILVMPHSFHLMVTENRKIEHLRTSSWLFPLYLLLISLPILPILWAVKSANMPGPVALYPALIGFILEQPILSLLAWIAALAATFTAMVAILISTSSICVNHLYLPFVPTNKTANSIKRLNFSRSFFTLSLLLGGLLIYAFFSTNRYFEYIYYATYIAIFQFLPGIIATLYWPQGTRKGLLAGLISGYTAWICLIVLPLLLPDNLSPLHFWQHYFGIGKEYWAMAAIVCLALNVCIFALVSFFSDHTEEERNAAQTCAQDKLSTPNRFHLALNSIAAFKDNLAKAIGLPLAERELNHALTRLGMDKTESRPFALRLLRRQIEVNLSGLYGTTVARQIVNLHLPYIKGSPTAGKHDMQFLEHRLELEPLALTGLAHEIDALRRYHRNTLEQLPIGICTINSVGEIMMWNQAIAELTHIETANVIGLHLAKLPNPWGNLLQSFSQNKDESLYQQLIEEGEDKRWFNLHKAHTSTSYQSTLLLEETTEQVLLEQELLHSERLASIGRLAAGIAHEIGNPVTGIACLAQNIKFDSEEEASVKSAVDIIEQTQRISRIVQSLVNFSHSGHHHGLSLSPVNLYHCANEAIQLLAFDKRFYTECISNQISSQHEIQGDPQLLQQAFLNLLKNALDAIDSDTGRINITSKELDETIELQFEDNGSGISPTIQQAIFEPFFTTKDIGQGTGLGLALVYGIIEEHQGNIQVLSPIPETGIGTRFTIQLKKKL